jgi:hypothetical protein
VVVGIDVAEGIPRAATVIQRDIIARPHDPAAQQAVIISICEVIAIRVPDQMRPVVITHI